MRNEEIIRQLEFFRDIGVDLLDLKPGKQANTPPGIGTPVRRVDSPASHVTASVPDVPRLAGPNDTAVKPPASLALPVEPAPIAPSGPAESLDDIRSHLGDCQRCKLAPTRTHIVFGSGNPKAEIVFVGEAPGSDEDQQGLPFVGAAGQLLTKIIESIGINREDAYICNILKCRPPQNRNPEPDEVLACSPFLKRQLEAIRPKIVCCLGKFAAQMLLRSTAPITKLRGEFHDIDGMRVIATFHPAYLLRSPEKKREVWEDMKQIRAELFRLRF